VKLVGHTVLDTYVVGEALGKGAMGTVYLGQHAKLKRKVAIKVMHEHLTGEPVLLERFRREGLLASKLNHVNVVAVLDVGETPDGKPVIVMEYAKGTSMADLMDAGPVPVERMLSLMKQILRGLDHAHGMGLIHRDLKPDNVILTGGDIADEVARIVDFGVAVLRAPDESVEGGRLTASGMIVGTPQYMSPEQAKAERTDHRTDLYALGVMMYEMISGITPFDGTAMEVALLKIDKDPPPFSERAPHVVVDRVLEAYMRVLLAREPKNRPATAQMALEMLELYERDRLAAASVLGIIDVDRALATISLPEPRR
jgi:eukaryotic-like serine/threonine-protein kinase